MKTLALTFLAIFGLAVTSPALSLGRKADMASGILTEETRDSVHEIVRTAIRRFRLFQRQTPFSGEQQSAISQILQRHRPEIRAQMIQGRDARRAMAAAAKENASSPATQAAARKIGDLACERALLAARISGEIRPLLTPEQQEQIESARDEIAALIDAAFAAPVR